MFTSVIDKWKFPLFLPYFLHFVRIAGHGTDVSSEDIEGGVLIKRLTTSCTLHCKDLRVNSVCIITSGSDELSYGRLIGGYEQVGKDYL